jgi:hypothetical protein
VLFQTGCAQRQTLTWETLGELRIVNRHFPVSNTKNYEETSISPGFWNLTLRAKQNDKVYLDLRHVNGNLSILDNGEWRHFTTWPPEAIKIWEEERKEKEKSEDLFSEIETHIWKDDLAGALYDNLLPSIKFPDTLQKSAPPDNDSSESEKEIEGKSPLRSHKQDRDGSSGVEEEKSFREWLRNFCIYATDPNYTTLDWQKVGNQDIALLVYTDWSEQAMSSQALSEKLWASLGSQSGNPEVFFRKNILGRNVVVLHTVKHNFIFDNHEANSPYLFKSVGDALILCHENSLWLLSPDCRKIQHYELPIQISEWGTWGAFFLKDRTLYVFGQSPTDPKKAVVLKTNLDDILSTEKADSPKP